MASRPIKRNNRYHHPDSQFTVYKCEKYGEFYEPAYEHVCKKKNSYRMWERTGVKGGQLT